MKTITQMTTTTITIMQLTQFTCWSPIVKSLNDHHISSERASESKIDAHIYDYIT